MCYSLADFYNPNIPSYAKTPSPVDQTSLTQTASLISKYKLNFNLLNYIFWMFKHCLYSRPVLPNGLLVCG